MVSITARKERNEYWLDIIGHAGYNPGNDIVCSAVSVLATTLAQKMRELDEIDLFSVMKCTMESGNVHIYANVRAGRTWRFEVVFDTIMTGFELLHNTYPGYVFLDGWENEE